MRKRLAVAGIGFVIIVVAGALLFYSAYYNSFYAIDRANALFSRAETAGFAEDMVAYLERGRVLLPKSGNPVWWFPTDRTDFSEIQRDIDSIIARATLLENLPRNSTAYQQGMDDLRGKTKALELQLGDASGYMFVSGYNLVVSAFWLGLITVAAYLLKRR